MSGDQLQPADETRRQYRRGHALVILLALLAACGEGRGPAVSAEAVPAGAAAAVGASAPAEGAGPSTGPETTGEAVTAPAETERPATIYYDLTTHDWYRRGEPILIDGRRYQPGPVQATGERRLKRGGEYAGVDFYGIDGGPQPYDTVYVPVYPGYWLPFVAEPQ